MDIGNLSRVDKLQRLLTLCLHGVFGHLKDSGGVFGVKSLRVPLTCIDLSCTRLRAIHTSLSHQ